MKRRKQAKPRKQVRGSKPRKVRKYFGTPSVLMVNTIIHAAVRVLRRERQRLRKVLAEEYAAIRKMPREQSELLLIGIEKESELLKRVLMGE